VQGWSDVPQDVPLFQSIVVFENYPAEAVQTVQGPNQSLQVLHVDSSIRNSLPFTVRAVPGPQLLLQILYDSGRFDAATVDWILGHFETLLHHIVAQPESRLVELAEKLTASDRAYQRMQEKAFQESRRQQLRHVRRKTISEAPIKVEETP
jgi:non-ribosomal peptide synthetase component F